MDNLELVLSLSIEEIKKGFIQYDNCYKCIFCGEMTEKGVIYQEDGVLYDAEKFMKIHIINKHKSVFEYLVNLDKKLTGISDHQRAIMRLLYQGFSDEEIQNQLGIGSSATVRNHRFILKEKERQAKIFLAMMELLKDGKKLKKQGNEGKRSNRFDLKYNITSTQKDRVIKKYLPQGINGKLKTFDTKEKNRLIILSEIIKKFDMNKVYNEKAVNEILETIYDDFATLRRYLIEYGFMERKSDGSQYWLKEDRKDDTKMDRRKELKKQYMEMKTEAGVYQIRNTINNKILIVATPNLKTMNGRRIGLQQGGHINKKLQEELKQFGQEAFVFEVLEVLKEKEDGYFDKAEELKKLEQKWLEKLQPYGEKGYN